MAQRGLTHREHVAAYFSLDTALTGARGSLQHGDMTNAVAEIEDAMRALERVAPAVSVSDASAVLGVSEPTIRLWIEKGLLAIIEKAPLKVSARDVSALALKLQALREAGLDKKQWAAVLQAARDQKELELPGAAEGLEEAQQMLRARAKRKRAATA